MTVTQAHAIPQTGSVAPDFELLSDDGTPIRLSSLRGKPVVLFFYPKDNTPACTIEACAMRDAFPRLDNSKAAVLGISPDSVQRHQRFRARFSLSYNLLADTEHQVAELYGVWREKSLFGRRYMGFVRTTFVIDANGVIADIFPNVKVLGHAAAVASAVARLG